MWYQKTPNKEEYIDPLEKLKELDSYKYENNMTVLCTMGQEQVVNADGKWYIGSTTTNKEYKEISEKTANEIYDEYMLAKQTNKNNRKIFE